MERGVRRRRKSQGATWGVRRARAEVRRERGRGKMTARGKRSGARGLGLRAGGGRAGGARASAVRRLRACVCKIANACKCMHKSRVTEDATSHPDVTAAAFPRRHPGAIHALIIRGLCVLADLPAAGRGSSLLAEQTDPHRTHCAMGGGLHCRLPHAGHRILHAESAADAIRHGTAAHGLARAQRRKCTTRRVAP